MNKKGMSNIEIVRAYYEGRRPFVQIGWKPSDNHKEGDIWTDSKNRTWIQRKTYRENINEKANIIRHASEQKCQCGQYIKWGTKRDVYFFGRTGMCENCVINFETRLRVLGIYPSYEQYKIESYRYGNLIDAQKQIKETISYFSNNNGNIEMLCNEEGFIERWNNTNREEIIKNAKQDLKLSIVAIKESKRRLTKLKTEYYAKCKEHHEKILIK